MDEQQKENMDEERSFDNIDVHGIFIGAGCNRVVNTVAWGPSGLVAFGAHNAVAIFQPQAARILTTLPGHKDIVNCVEWLPRNKDIYKFDYGPLEEQFLLSGSADGVIMIWAYLPSHNKWRWVLQVPKSHEKGVTCIAGAMLNNLDGLFVSSSSDGTVYVWEVGFPSQSGGDCNLSMLQTIHVGTRTMVSLALAELPGNAADWILAMGGLDNKVHLYVSERKGKFVPACELKGHQDWIRSLDFSIPAIAEGRMEIFVTSSSQDKTIRIWKISFHSSLSDFTEEAQSIHNISLKTYIEGPIFKLGTSVWQVSLESLLVGHEDWVYSVSWQPPLKSCIDNNNACWIQPQSILSASMDRTMMIWRPERKTGIWINDVTVGELSHSALGFYGGLWSPKGDAILAHGYGGSFHLWKNVGLSVEDWQPQLVPSGHSAAVLDLGWAKSRQFILSASHDQTTRIFAPWERHKDDKLEISWHEIARPQVHGHDINCMAIIKGEGNHRYVSGADEKVGRVFEASLSFLRTLQHTAWGHLGKQDVNNEDIQILGANMSALGLSQKPIYVQGSTTRASVASSQDFSDGMETIPEAVPVVLTEPPLEENLSWNTLWPESHKLYGHGNELFAMCCNHEGKIVATACKAQSSNVAEIWLWQVGSWKAIGRLHSHALTVTQMEFSHDDHFLLSVSRDRHFSVFRLEKNGIDEVKHELVARHDAHKRIIWSCSWNARHHVFATGSRDRMVKIWKIKETKSESSVTELLILPQFSSSVTAVSWSPRSNFKDDLVAVGMESGLIDIWRVSLQVMTPGGEHFQPCQRFDTVTASRIIGLDIYLCHVATVHRLVWRETSESESSMLDNSSPTVMHLASCGSDHTVRIFNVVIA
uniref:Elongator complex protein 2 n=1 Tax=Cupressus duclouxiana TaxID=103966 RepID=A0A3Q8CCT1_9CONI|nr:putative ATELP2 [Cupressus duclouxiana]